jgi:hypothetical protein
MLHQVEELPSIDDWLNQSDDGKEKPSLVLPPQPTVLPLDHLLDPFFLPSFVSHIDMSTVPFICERQSTLPCQLDEQDQIINLEETLRWLRCGDNSRYLCVTNRRHSPITIRDRERDASVRLFYHCSSGGEKHRIWVSKVVDVPYGWVFFDDDGALGYLAHCVLLVQPRGKNK